MKNLRNLALICCGGYEQRLFGVVLGSMLWLMPGASQADTATLSTLKPEAHSTLKPKALSTLKPKSLSTWKSETLAEYSVTHGNIFAEVISDSTISGRKNSAKTLSLTLVSAASNATSEAATDKAQQLANSIADTLANNLSTEMANIQSELAQLNAHRIKQPQSPALQNVLQLCESWRVKTGNALSCRLGSLHTLWQQAAQSGELPERTELRKMARSLAALEQPLTNKNASAADLQWQLGNLAVGYLLDAALTQARTLAPAARGIKLELDGSAVYWGVNAKQQAWPVALKQVLPAKGIDRGVLALAPHMPQQKPYAITYSGNVNSKSGKNDESSKSDESGNLNAKNEQQIWQVGTRRFNRTLNPDDAWPVMFAPSVVVVAADATTATALVQALTVMPIAQGLHLVKSIPEAEALIMTETGKSFASTGWYSLLIPDALHQPLWERDMQFLVEYQIPALSVAEYRRPYVAIWITNSAKESVRQLLVHGDRLRWLREIPLWWRKNGRRDESMLDGLTRATPKPGQHMLVWDGRDDFGHRVEQGEYILHIEAAREHGEHEVVTVPFTLSNQPFSHQEQGAKELGRIKVSFTPAP